MLNKKLLVLFLLLAANSLEASTLPYFSSSFKHCLYGLRRRYSGWKAKKIVAEQSHESKLIDWLRKQPVRDLSKDAVTREYLKTHKVFISLTTSPRRIHEVHKVFATLDLRNVEEVVLSIPERFGRDGSEYEIPQSLLTMPKLKILRTPLDYGPATKLIPAAQYAKALDPASLVITIDDDTAYPFGMVNEMIYGAAHLPGTVVGRSGVDIDHWRLAENPLSKADYRNLLPMAEVDKAELVDVVEGYAAVAYPVSLVNVREIIDWSSRCPECKLADDLVISLSLAKQGVPRVRFLSKYYSTLVQFNYGMQQDALHKGAGIERTDEVPESGETYNILNYRRVFNVLRSELGV